MAYTTINKSTDYFNTVTYSGNGSNNHTITGVGFDADFVWNKLRNGTDDHRLFDKVRGINKYLESNNNNTEVTDAILSTNSDGYVLTNAGEVNSGSGTYVGWNWKANGAGSANTDGTINSTVSVNTTAGFSIVSYTGTGSNGTVGHGLGVTPKVIITKARTNSGRFWGVYHSSLGNTGSQPLNDTQAFDVSSTYWQDTNPTSSVFSVGINGDTNSSSGMIAYCFADVVGYSKFGSYNGNNNATDGAFIYTGFKPAFLIVKDGQSGQYWHMFDNKREPFNDDDFTQLSPNTSATEATVRTDRGVAKLDFLSNGFKWRTDNSGFNGTNKYIYMCFAEAPLVGTNNVPCTAR